MSEQNLNNRRVLVVEDEYMLADEMRGALSDAGATVLGPVSAVEDALALIETDPCIDGAVLDANLQGEPVFPVADKLEERRIPFVFSTGYDASSIPARFTHATLLGKPTSMSKLCKVLDDVMRSGR